MTRPTTLRLTAALIALAAVLATGPTALAQTKKPAHHKGGFSLKKALTIRHHHKTNRTAETHPKKAKPTKKKY